MAEVAVDTDAGKRRRLPVWMVRANSSNETSNYGEGDRSCSLSEENPDMQDAGSELRSSTRVHKSNPAQAIDSSVEFKTIGKQEARQRKRKASRRNVGQDDSLTNHGIAKTKTTKEAEGGKTTVDNEAATKRKGRKSKRPKHSEIVCSAATSDNEIELTVEDLVHIAEEYVNADRQKQHERSTAREYKSEIHPSSSSVSSGISTRGPPQISRSSQALSRCTTMSTSNLADTHLYDEKNPQVENFATNIPQTGDPSQDMLDLLLGPLLKKPRSEEHENRTVATESMTLTHKTSKPSATSKEIWKEEVLLTKRKTTLKDKVAVLLD